MTTHKIIDMQALRVFLATAKDCNMSQAAVRLGITQSAVSQAIGQLEEQFGAALLDRQRRPLTLTSAGLALYQKGTVLVDAALNLKGAVLEASRGARPDIRLGMVDSFAATSGTSVAKKMLDCVSHLALHTGLSFELAESLLERETDLVFTTDSLKDTDGLVRARLITERFVVITAPDLDVHIQTPKDLLRLSEQVPMIRYKQRSHLGKQAERVLRFSELKIPRGLEVDTADAHTAMVAGGLGWGLTTPLCLLQAQEHARRVNIHFLAPPNETRSVYLLARDGEYERLVRQTFDIAREVLMDECLPRIAAIHPRLAEFVQVHEWSTRAAGQLAGVAP